MTDLVSYLSRQRTETAPEKTDNKQKLKDVSMHVTMLVYPSPSQQNGIPAALHGHHNLFYGVPLRRRTLFSTTWLGFCFFVVSGRLLDMYMTSQASH